MMIRMKKITKIFLLAAAALFAFAACTDPEADKLEKIVGEWHYNGVESGVEIDITVGIGPSGTCSM